MYSFGTDLLEDSQALQDIVAEQGTSLNALQQLTDSLRRDAASLKSVTVEQQGHIDELRQQVCLHACYTTYSISIQHCCIYLHFCHFHYVCISCQLHDLSSQHPSSRMKRLPRALSVSCALIEIYYLIAKLANDGHSSCSNIAFFICE